MSYKNLLRNLELISNTNNFKMLSSKFNMDINIATVLMFLATFTLSYILFKLVEKGKNQHLRFPPCLPCIPILGSLPFLPRSMSTIPSFFMEKAEKLGVVFAMYSGERYTVVLNGRDAIEAAYLKHPTDFADREPPYVEKHFTNVNDKGLVFVRYTQDFIKNRRIALTILKEFGFGTKNLMDNRILTEVGTFIDEAKKMKSRPFNPERLTRACIANVILNIIFGTRFDYEDETLHAIDRDIRDATATLQPMLNVFPILRFLPHFKRGLDESKRAMFSYHDRIHVEMAKCLADSTTDSYVRSYIEKMGPDYDKEELFYMARDLIGAATDTTSSAFLWGLVAFANHPRVQEHLHKEIDSVVPKDRLPSTEDQQKLPYLEAAILELMRWRTLVPLSLLRATLCDTEVEGSFIPAGAIIIANLYSVHMDPKVWPEPEIYKPGRFLDGDGNVFGRDRVVPFSLGKRSCLGEPMGQQQLFLFVAGILQHFDILPPEGQQSVEGCPQGESVVTPAPYEIRLIPRF